MSHISAYKAELKLEGAGENTAEFEEARRLLREAVEAVAEEHGGFVSHEISDYFGRKTGVDLGLITREFPAGIGIQINSHTGEVEFLYDSYGGHQRTIDRLCEEIKQSYLTLAVSRALRDLNYEVEYEESAGEETGRRRVVIRGVL